MKKVYILLFGLAALITQGTGINAVGQSQEEIEFQEKVGFNRAIARGDFQRAYDIAIRLIDSRDNDQSLQGHRLFALAQEIAADQAIAQGDFHRAVFLIETLESSNQTDIANALRGKLRAARGW
ncbi:MAG: hypothetical protein M1114_01165 [Candidatus Dependentiae bacterium]|nr:hypothetical protein [Candidatus Dependentiae bacterium]